VIDAAVYLAARTFVNGVRRRVARLREPRYLIAVAVGLLYFWWIFARPGTGGLDGRSPAATLPPETFGLLIAWGLLAFVTLGWVFGSSRNPLPFAPAEIQFLFTAPLTRRQVIHFKLLRLQVPLLASAVIAVLLLSRGALTPARLMQALGAWLLFTTFTLHSAATALMRASLAEHGVTGLRRHLLVLTVLAGVLLACVLSVRNALPEIAAAAEGGPRALIDAVAGISDRGALSILLWPFRAVAAPLAAPSAVQFVAALPAAALVLGAHYVWVVRSATRFEEVAVEESQRVARRLEAMRRGTAGLRTGKGPVSRPLYALRAHGPPAEAFMWKGIVALRRQFGMRIVVVIGAGVAAIAAVAGLGRDAGGSGGTRVVVGMVLLAFAGLAVLFGPRAMRWDLRDDLLRLDVLKSYPVRGRDIVLGEVLGPTVVLTVFAWLCGGIGAAALLTDGVGRSSREWLAPLGIGVLGVPAVVFVQLVTQNGFAVLFPGWVALGTQPPAGVERLGQTILVVIGSVVVLVLALVPAAVFAGATFALLRAASAGVGALVAAAVGSAVLGFEGYGATYLLGARLERTDPADVGAVP
jgi:hypothetical protein